MSLIDAGLDSLPYIDPAPTEAQRASAAALIAQELPTEFSTTPHPRLSPLTLPTSTSAGIQLLELAANKQKLAAIDASRYSDSALEPPTSSPNDPNHLEDWRATIKRAYTLYSYLAARNQQLSLLEAYGKNAWLIANSQVEEELRSVEKALADCKERTEEVNRERKERQEAVRGEMEGLQESWKEGVRRLVGVMVATAELDELKASGMT